MSIAKESAESDPVRIMVAVELPLIRSGIVALLGREANLQVDGIVGRVEDVLPEVGRVEPDLVILDTDFHRREPDLIDRIHALSPDASVLVLVNHSDEECVIRSMLMRPDAVQLSGEALDRLNECCLLALRSSARGCVPKTASEERFLGAVRSVVAGEVAAGPWLEALVQAQASPPPSFSRQGPNRVSARELEIITLVARGFENKEIARKLDIREQTVKNHLGRVMRKVGVRNRQELAVFAVRQHLVPMQNEVR